MAIKRMKKETVKKVSVNFKNNVLNYLAEVIANSDAIFGDGDVEIDDIKSLPTEVKVVKTSRESVLLFEVSGIQIKAAVTIPKSAVEGDVIAIATANEEEAEAEEAEAEE